MSDTPGSRHDPLAAFRQRGFQWLSLSRFSSGVAQGLSSAALAWQVYAISGSPLQLGILGLVRFVPQLLAALYAGAVADTYDRKRIVMVAQAVNVACTLVLLIATVAGVITLPIIYGLVMMLGLSGAFDGPARQSLLPSVVSEAVFPHAIRANSTIQSFAQVSGPGLAGLLMAAGGVPAAYAANLALIVVSMVAVAALRPRAIVQPRRAVTWEAIREGIQFVRHRAPLLGSMTLDMFAVIFGGAQALLPVYAQDILHVDEVGYGILSSSIAAGGLLMSVILVLAPTVVHIGRALLISVAAFGLATIAFGVSRWFPLSVATYMAVGMADQVSMVMRQVTIQLATPDHLRGRVTAVNQVFVGTSNQLGAVESGFVAAATSATFAVVSGGIGCLAVLGVIAATMPDLRRYTIHHVRDGAMAPGTGDRPAETPEAAGG